MDIMNLTGKELDVKLIQKIYPMEDEINIIVPSSKDRSIIENEINSSVSPDADLFNVSLKISNLINKNYYVYNIVIDCPNYLAKYLENNLMDYGISILYPVYKNNKIIHLIKSCNYR